MLFEDAGCGIICADVERSEQWQNDTFWNVIPAAATPFEWSAGLGWTMTGVLVWQAIWRARIQLGALIVMITSASPILGKLSRCPHDPVQGND